NLLDSHDTARFVTLARNDKTAFRLATLFQMTFIGAPSIFYGDEIGLMGGHDPACRAAFPWDSADWDTGLLHEIQRLIALRKKSPALRRGDYRCLLAQEDVHVHLRAWEGEGVLVALNRSLTQRRIDVPTADALREGQVLHEVWTREPACVERAA